MHPGLARAAALQTLRSGRRAFWILLVVLVASFAVFVLGLLAGVGAPVVAASGALTAALVIAWSRLAFGLGRLEQDVRRLDEVRRREDLRPEWPGARS